MTQVETPQATVSAVPDSGALLMRLRETYDSGLTRPLAWRDEQLESLGQMLVECEDELVAALVEDLGRPPFEAWAADLRVTGRDIEHLRKHLKDWAAPEKQKTPWILRPSKAEIVREPLGVVLVISPWNYPVHLLLSPLAAAIAAGNAAVCKPSEVSSATSRAIARLLPQYLDPRAYAVVEGGVAETTELLEQRWDHVFYTGNGTVGRVVAAAAAKHLTPVTLELGGKSPVIVETTADVELAASRVASAKFLNAGQTCIAADYVLVQKEVEQEFLDALREEIRSRYGLDPRQSADFGRIVNTAHVERLRTLLDAGGFETVYGGQVDVDARYVAPTVLTKVTHDAAVMTEEIFGPVLPVLSFDTIDQAIDAVTSGDKPLALYVFSGDDDVIEQVLTQTSSGVALVNDTLNHMLVPGLPFGGVGQSGYGAYHGRWGFETFSHRKSVLRRPRKYADPPALKPPYKRWKQWLSRRTF